MAASQNDQRPTLDSVARTAGVSRQTVSNVINTPARVSPETARRVQDAIAQTGYRPNLAARQLRTGRSGMIGLRLRPVTDGINGVILDRFLHALTEEGQQRDLKVVLFTARSDEDEIAQYSSLMSTSELDGFVLTDTHRGDQRTTWLRDQGVPFVTFGRPWATGTDMAAPHCWVDVDGSAGTRAATRLLLDQGLSRIAFLGWPQGSGIGDERHAGWADEMRAHGLSDRDLEQLTCRAPDSVAQASRAAAHLLQEVPDAAGMVCASDSLALGAAEAARALGRPLALVGFDDTPVAAALGLTSVAQPLVETAHAALDLLVPQLAQGRTAPRHILLEPTLVVRQSSQPGSVLGTVGATAVAPREKLKER